MFENFKNLNLKQAFKLLVLLLFFSGIIVFFAVLEVGKTADFQRLAGKHSQLFGLFTLQVEKLKNIDSPEKHFREINMIFDLKSDIPGDMGVNLLLSKIKSFAQIPLDRINFFEGLALRAAGFGEVLTVAVDDINIIIEMEKIIKDYRSHNISHDKLLKEMELFSEEMVEDYGIFTDIIDEVTNLVSTISFGLVTILLILLTSLYWYIYRSVVLPLSHVRNDIHTSSGELHANSKQQLQSASHQTSSMSEIGSVMQELVATSKQIFETSSRATVVARDTNKAVENGHASIDQAMDGMKIIKKKVEISASNMLSLGEKSQHIGVVLDVINELSQQMTVLSYNATIEAAGTGEMGKRFMAVADRIIKLAERSVESAKEVKTIIEDIQTDSNKTIMSTEDGIKAVEKGILFSQEVKGALKRITGFTEQVMTSIDEINLSVNQQKTAIEQAASEVGEITQLVQETEDGAKQVADAATQLLDMAAILEKL